MNIRITTYFDVSFSIYGKGPLHPKFMNRKRIEIENNTHLRSNFWVLIATFHFISCICTNIHQPRNVLGSQVHMLLTMDQADTQACQNHHSGVCFPPPHFQHTAIHYYKVNNKTKLRNQCLVSNAKETKITLLNGRN